MELNIIDTLVYINNMGSRWRTWDLDCLEATLLTRELDDEVEPLIALRSRREIPHVDFSSLVLPKEALFSTDDNHTGKNSRSRGRGRSLANRALGFDKPSRRPGEKDTSEKTSPKPLPRSQYLNESPKPTLGSQFFGSEYLYEELFPSLDQSAKKADQKPPVQTKSVWEGKRRAKSKKESSNQPSIKCAEEKNVTDKPIFDQVDVPKSATTDTSTSDNSILSDNCANNKDISKSEDFLIETSYTVSGRDNVQHNKIELQSSVDSSECAMRRQSEDLLEEKQSEEFNQLPEKSGFKEHQNSTIIKEDFCLPVDQIESDDNQQLIEQSNNNEAESCLQLCEIPNDETCICKEMKQVQISDNECNNCSTDSTTNELHLEQDAKTDSSQPKDTTAVSSTTNTLLPQIDFQQPNDSETENHLETGDTKENLEDFMDTSANEEMEPCNILLENLPLAITEEELGDIVEPFGEAVSYNFQEKDDTSKRYIVRMVNSLSGELLVVSLDGLELDGFRIKATMVDS